MSDIHHLSGAYAMDAVDDLERAAFERHLAGCAECRAEVESFREATALLAAAVEVEPPERLREAVLGGIATIRPEPPRVAPTRSRARRPRWVPLLVAAVVLAAVGVSAAIWRPWVTTAPEPTLAQQVLQAPDAASVRLDFPDGSHATVTRSVRLATAVIRTERMAPPPAGKVRELWLQTPDGTMTPAGLMPSTPEATVVLAGDAAAAAGAGITVEPAGGSPHPTSDPVAVFDFARAT